ncbi:MAG: GNAT family N-acetyltransferase [Erysipelotrichaceae bacterium]
MIIKKLNIDEYQGKRFTVSYETAGYYDIQRDDNGFRIEYNKFNKSITKIFDDEFFSEWLEEPAGYGLFEDGQMTGYVEGSIERWNNRYRITNICIFDENKRNKGSGRILLDTIMNEALSSGARMVILETKSCNEKAISFYRNYGFEIIGFDLYSYSNEDAERHEIRIEMGMKIKNKNSLK